MDFHVLRSSPLDFPRAARRLEDFHKNQVELFDASMDSLSTGGGDGGISLKPTLPREKLEQLRTLLGAVQQEAQKGPLEEEFINKLKQAAKESQEKESNINKNISSQPIESSKRPSAEASKAKNSSHNEEKKKKEDKKEKNNSSKAVEEKSAKKKHKKHNDSDDAEAPEAKKAKISRSNKVEN